MHWLFHLHSLIYSLIRKFIENLFVPDTVPGGRNSGEKISFLSSGSSKSGKLGVGRVVPNHKCL